MFPTIEAANAMRVLVVLQITAVEDYTITDDVH